MRRLAAFFVQAVLAVSAFGQPGEQQRKITHWNAGTRIEVTLDTGDKLVGRRGAIQSEGFVLEPDKPPMAGREVRFSDVRSARTKWTTGKKWGVALAIYAPLLAMALILGK